MSTNRDLHTACNSSRNPVHRRREARGVSSCGADLSLLLDLPEALAPLLALRLPGLPAWAILLLLLLLLLFLHARLLIG